MEGTTHNTRRRTNRRIADSTPRGDPDADDTANPHANDPNTSGCATSTDDDAAGDLGEAERPDTMTDEDPYDRISTSSCPYCDWTGPNNRLPFHLAGCDAKGGAREVTQ